MGKRFFDFSIALFGLILFSPLLVIACLAIKVASSGPIFDGQKRIGRGFRPFYLYEFCVKKLQDPPFIASNGLSKEQGEPTKASCSERCRWLEKLSPFLQLFNVLKGEMSLVGPKPAPPDFVERFKAEYRIILKVAPGILDLSSIESGDAQGPLARSEPQKNGYTRVILPKKVKLAKAYVQGRSFVLDLKILFTKATTVFLSSPAPFGGREDVGHPQMKDLIFSCRSTIIFAIHFLSIFFCNYAAFLLRFDGEIPPSTADLFLRTVPYVVAVRLGILYLFGIHHGLWRYAGLRDMLNIGWAILSSSMLIWTMGTFAPWSGYPRSIYVIDAFLLFVALSVFRSSKRIYSALTQTGIGTRRVLIIGAGKAGEMIVREMKQDRRYGSHPVAFIDDDPKKRSKKIHNIPVIGNSHEMEVAFSSVRPDEILIAIPSAGPEQIKRIIHRCKPLKCPIKTLPNLAAIFGGRVSVGDIRNLDIEDLIGRAEIRIHDSAVDDKIRGKKVMVTGAGGSIGSELCRQIAMLQPRELILVERNENNLYRIELDLVETFPSVSLKVIMADILNTEKMDQCFSAHRPHIVFHAAAYKHVPMMEKNPIEAIRNNITGTYRMMTLSDRYGADVFVLISTDKAVAPSSIMGATKRVAEMMCRFFNDKSRTKLVSVRFGNVLESNGSVVPLFREQIKHRKPLRVTHPEVKRYFISIQEAVQLVLEASALGEGGEVFVLDMGKPIKIIDLARTMITLSGFTPEEDIPIQLIGLRPGEKLHEALFEAEEEVIQTRHEKIRLARNGRVHADFLSRIERFAAMNHRTSPSEVKSLLKELIPTCRWEQTVVPASIQAETSVPAIQ
ncbi:MAG: polysaccharide biosynthesis protein [Nitrospiria bacterium]